MKGKPIYIQSGVAADVVFGDQVKVILPVNLYGCLIGDQCFVGPFTEIQKGVTIGERTKIQSHTFICELVTIGHNCFIGHGVTLINDKFEDGEPAAGNKEKWKETKIGNFVSIGSGVTLLPVNICDHAVIGAGSVVTSDIEEPGCYAGNPAKLLKQIKKHNP